MAEIVLYIEYERAVLVGPIKINANTYITFTFNQYIRQI